MKNSIVQVTYPKEKLEAIRQYIGRKGVDMSAELQATLSRLYDKHVPRDVREFIDAWESSQAANPRTPRRPARSPAGRASPIPAPQEADE